MYIIHQMTFKLPRVGSLFSGRAIASNYFFRHRGAENTEFKFSLCSLWLYFSLNKVYHCAYSF